MFKQCPIQRQQWIDSLRTELNDRQYVCDLHFHNDAINNSYIVNLPNGEINKIIKGRITRSPGSVPLIVNVKQSSIIDDCKVQALNETSKMPQLMHEQQEQKNQQQQHQASGEHQGQLLYEISEKPESLHEQPEQNQQQQQQQEIEEYRDQSLNQTSEKPELLPEQNQQQQVIEEQFNFDDVRIENQEQSHQTNQEIEQINNNVPQHRLPVKRKLKYPDEIEKLKRQKYSEHIDINRQVNMFFFFIMP